MKLHNESLAIYLLKSNITKVSLLNCNEQCSDDYRAKDHDYSLLHYGNKQPEWLHFAQATYYDDNEEVIRELFQIRNPNIKGFSIFWKNPLRYHKIEKSVKDFIVSYAEENGLYYQEIPSLNLRAVENKIVLIFTRNKRIPKDLPSFVEKTPPKNYLAIQTTFKMVTNLPYIREFILYHLRAGVDKFFLYDNDFPPGSPSFFR